MKNTLAAIMLALALAAAPSVSAQTEVLLLTERGGQHEPFVSAALDWPTCSCSWTTLRTTGRRPRRKPSSRPYSTEP